MPPSHRAENDHTSVVAHTNQPPPDLGGRYDVGEVLGHGGMAEVRIGVDRRLGRTVAVKTLRADLASDPTFQAR
ncbi:MAG: Stk1 family PASTA domain-containing Ser/Thr kinase, partial [Actinopolymorphaceae bacterium]